MKTWRRMRDAVEASLAGKERCDARSGSLWLPEATKSATFTYVLLHDQAMKVLLTLKEVEDEDIAYHDTSADI